MSSQSIIWSLCFQHSGMPCSNLLSRLFRGYYRSFWLNAMQEMWSSSSGSMRCSVSAPRDPLCHSLDLCHCPHSIQNNFCCPCCFSFLFFCLDCFATTSVRTKASALGLTFVQMLFRKCAPGCRVLFQVGFVFTRTCHHESLQHLVLMVMFYKVLDLNSMCALCDLSSSMCLMYDCSINILEKE